ncbi:MAG: OsmC family protein [Bdellovibrionales bacterium]|nr:OsmC family protein [Bdellovibrionales bacterium]
MVTLNIKYLGEKNCSLVHEPSGASIMTDAPKDNHGKGESFSATDLFAASLVSCMLLTMAIKGEPLGYDFEGCYGKVIKEMASDPRKIKKLTVELHLKKNLNPEQKNFLENTAFGCPVKLSLHPDIIIASTFIYDLD